MGKPYKEEILLPNIKLRTFSSDINPDELKWHWDEEDRVIRTLGESNWQFQFDDELPFRIDSHDIYIPEGIMHRIIKGDGDLSIIIETTINENEKP